jgi:hypothetical protein
MSCLKYIPSKTIKRILDDPYTRGAGGEGKDYQHVKNELLRILWDREAKQQDAVIREIDNMPENVRLYKIDK